MNNSNTSKNFEYFNYEENDQLEKFHKEIYKTLFFVDGMEYNEEIKQKMYMFSLAYNVAKLYYNNEEVEIYNIKINSILKEIKTKTNFEKGGAESKKYFRKIIVILLKDFYKNLENDKKDIFRNIFGIKALVYLKELEKTTQLKLNEDINEKIKKTNKTLYDILITKQFKDSTNKEDHLNKNGFYKNRGVKELFYKVLGKCEINNNEFDEKLNKFNIAYDLVKYKFRYNKRDSGERYFNHLTSVANLYLENEENPTYEGTLIAILHDIIEDTDINGRDLTFLFGEEISSGVVSLSKPSVEEYLKEKTEKTFFRNGKKNGFLNSKGNISDDIILKEKKGLLNRLEKKKLKIYNQINKQNKKIRNTKYFEKFLKKGIKGNLSIKEKEQIKIKFYDRIHNTKTLLGFKKIKKIFDKIDETITYFLPINSEHFQKVNILLIKELEKTISLLEDTFSENLSNEDRLKIKEIKDDILNIKNNTINVVKNKVISKCKITLS